jgi:signal transduction histidine kinase
MHAEDEANAGRPLNSLDRLRHDLRSPLTTIRGRAYLLARAVRRAPSLTEEERTGMLTGVAAIETAVAAMVAVIDGIADDRGSPGNDEGRDRA